MLAQKVGQLKLSDPGGVRENIRNVYPKLWNSALNFKNPEMFAAHHFTGMNFDNNYGPEKEQLFKKKKVPLNDGLYSIDDYYNTLKKFHNYVHSEVGGFGKGFASILTTGSEKISGSRNTIRRKRFMKIGDSLLKKS